MELHKEKGQCLQTQKNFTKPMLVFPAFLKDLYSESDLPKDDATTSVPSTDAPAKTAPPSAAAKEKKQDKDIDDMIYDLTHSNDKESIPISAIKRKTKVKTSTRRKMPHAN